MEEKDSKSGAERRTAPRATVQTQVKIFYPDLKRLTDEICKDISVGGMFIESAAPPAVGTQVRFDLHVPTKKPRVVQGEGVVVWSHPGGAGDLRPVGFGVRFSQLDPRFRTLIFRIVDRHIQLGGDPFDLDLEDDPD
jgi:uncharacterized protein (TIGR02266 family)